MPTRRKPRRVGQPLSGCCRESKFERVGQPSAKASASAGFTGAMQAKGQRPLPQKHPRIKPTIEIVRYYTTKSMEGGVRFTCIACKHTVTTLEFDRANGNPRTQAAAALNRHAAEVHLPRKPVPDRPVYRAS